MASRLLIWLILAYRAMLSPWFGGHCRFHPTCSRYMIGAIEHHGAVTGTWLGLRRICRCHPWGGYGYDPP